MDIKERLMIVRKLLCNHFKQPLDLLAANAPNLLIHPLNAVSSAIFGNVSLTVLNSCYLQNAMLFHRSPTTSHPPLP